ncbi:PEP-CTERM sorting domain-containing protein [Opitutaceae bacterium TAV4]|nr:PEP-CTERM sorting domain-containing protein [Opitutaceae bacterium TAV4]RRK01117.1 PEP-CTERM sorting domain-containing protein [Opitutaceae bacterium TAV3]
MNTKFIQSLAFAALSCLASVTATAATLVTYDFENTSDLLAPNPASIAAGINADTLALNHLANNSYNYSNPANRAITLMPSASEYVQTSYSVSTALTNATYLSLKLTVAPGQTLALDSISLQAAGGGSASYRAFYMFSNLTGFTSTTDVILSGRMDYSGSGGTLPARTTGLKDYSVSFASLSSAAAYTNISGGTEVEFRIYIQTDSTGRSLDIGNITLNGTLTPAPVPEPATTALLLALGVLASCLWLRRRRQS